VVQKTVLVGRELWVTCYGDLDAWPSITWTVLSGPDAVFSRPVAIGVMLNPNKGAVLSGPRCTKWTKVAQKTVLVGPGLRVSCYGVPLKPGLVLCGLY